MQTIQLTLTFIPFEEQTPEMGKTIIVLRETGQDVLNYVEIETEREVDAEFMRHREWNSYTHWCYLPIIKT